MTSQTDLIQTLIDKIDTTLIKTVSRLPWVVSGQISQQRQVLQQARDYLVMQRSLTLVQTTQKPAASGQDDQAHQTVQSMIQEMNDLRSSLLRPLQSEVITLTQQRNALLYEVRQLEAYKQSQLLQSSNSSELTSSQVEQLQSVHERADQVLGSLDTTLRVVFDSLQQDIEVYQNSLSQGLDKLHSLGEQGETLFTALVSRLAQQLGREASSYLPPQPSQGMPSSNAPFQPTQTPALIRPAIAPNLSQTAFDSTRISLPYPGTEMPFTSKSSESFPSQPDSIHTLTDLLDQLPHETQPSLATLAKLIPIPNENLLPQSLSTQDAELDL